MSKRRKSRRSVLTVGTVKSNYSFAQLESVYPFPEKGQSIVQAEHAAATKEGWSKNRWTTEYVLNTCAVRLSVALNKSGYSIPEHDLGNNRRTWTSNQDPSNEYIVSADDMGKYLRAQLGSPSLSSGGTIRNKSILVHYLEALDRWNGFKGIVYLDAKNHGKYGASGHVDLLVQKRRGKRKVAWIVGMKTPLEDYVSSRLSVAFVLHVWLLEGFQRKRKGSILKRGGDVFGVSPGINSTAFWPV